MVSGPFHSVPWLLMLLAGLLTGCDRSRQSEPVNVIASEVQKESASLSEDQARLWSQSCALCHVTGVGGAPRIGVSAEWEPRLLKGREVLLSHTLEGFNNMPPLGYCMSCEISDFSSMIDFMTGEIE